MAPISRICLLLFISQASAVASLMFDHWEQQFSQTTDVPFANDISDSDLQKHQSFRYMKEIMEYIHAQQHISKESCKSRRLLVVQLKTNSFEGIGSLIKQLIFGLSNAIHSNRTMIWGHGLPYLFEKSRDYVTQEDSDKVRIANYEIDCSQAMNTNGGVFGCFFHSIARCTLQDMTSEETLLFAQNAYNESARVMYSEYRRAVNLFHPPYGMFEYLWGMHRSRGEEYEIRGQESHIWAAAVSGYVFRLLPSAKKVFDDNYQRLVQRVAPEYDDDERDQSALKSWGLHIRHGDLKALANVYRYKKVFEFEDYFAAARDLSHKFLEIPNFLFVATDSVYSSDLFGRYERFLSEPATAPPPSTPKKSSRRRVSASPKVNYIPKHSIWYNASSGEAGLPQLLVFENEVRFRTPHGSHTVAAEGACVGKEERKKVSGEDTMGSCAVEFETILHYQRKEEHRSVPRKEKLMRVIIDAIEDLYLLSRNDVLVAQASSHYSTVAALLIWARTGCVNSKQRILYLDEDAVKEGVTPTALLEGMNLLNKTYGLDPATVPDAGRQRWQFLTNQFITGHPQHANLYVRQPGEENPWSFDHLMYWDSENLTPKVPEWIFYREARSWFGGPYIPLWPGCCPEKLEKGQNVVSYITANINLGVDQHEATHPSQAMQCWRSALHTTIDAIALVNSGERIFNEETGEAVTASHLATFVDVVQGNIGSLSLTDFLNVGETNLLQMRNPQTFESHQLELWEQNRRLQQSSRSKKKGRGSFVGDDAKVPILPFEDFFRYSANVQTPLEARRHLKVQSAYNMTSMLTGEALEARRLELEAELERMLMLRERLYVASEQQLDDFKKSGLPTH